MPSLSSTSLDRLIEPSNASSSAQAGPSDDRSTPFSFYPPLYATPSHQRPPSPTAFSPSPYVLNFKRRAPVQLPQQNGEKGSNSELSIQPLIQQQRHEMDGFQGNGTAGIPSESGRIENGERTQRKAQNAVTESGIFEIDLEKRETSPSRNRDLANHNTIVCDGTSVIFDHEAAVTPRTATLSRSSVSNEEAEFFDAADSVFSESANEDEAYSTSASPGRFVQRRLEEMRKRIKAEEHVVLLQRCWKEMAKRCSTIGVSFPSEFDDLSEYAEVLNQEFLVAKLVGEAIARAVVRAEKEEQLELIIGMKNREISRLWDKLQYLELVNREMSQRNQEVTELNQRRKKRRQRRQKLALNAFCAAFCIGSAGLLSYKYIPWDEAKEWADSVFKSSAVDRDTT